MPRHDLIDNYCSNCLIQLCAKGKIAEFERQVANDPSKLCIVDKKGRGPLHHAVKTGQIIIMDFIVSNGAGHSHFQVSSHPSLVRNGEIAC